MSEETVAGFASVDADDVEFIDPDEVESMDPAIPPPRIEDLLSARELAAVHDARAKVAAEAAVASAHPSLVRIVEILMHAGLRVSALDDGERLRVEATVPGFVGYADRIIDALAPHGVRFAAGQIVGHYEAISENCWFTVSGVSDADLTAVAK